MRAQINHGNRGTSMDKLMKRFGYERPYQYWMRILDEFISGKRTYALCLFNQMKENDQKTMLLNMDSEKESFRDFVIQNL